MRVRSAVLAELVATAYAGSGAPARADDAAVQKLVDCAAIEALVIQYVTALDTLDADAYAAGFAEDAVFELPGAVSNRGSGRMRR